MTDEGRIVRWLRTHPRSSPREVAEALFVDRGARVKVGQQLHVGARLSRMEGEGLLTRVFNSGWRYSVAPAADAIRLSDGKPGVSIREET